MTNMSSQDTKEALRQAIIIKLDKQRPSPGRHVQITHGKYTGQSGEVIQHEKMAFDLLPQFHSIRKQ